MSRLAPDPRRPVHWSWRPSPWDAGCTPELNGHLPPGKRIGRDVALFHDAAVAAFALRSRGDGLLLEAEDFDGSYLSFACDLPADALPLCCRGRLFECAASFRTDPPMTSYLRLNLRYGPEPRRSVSLPRQHDSVACAAFDLDNAPDSAGLLQGWVEMMFDCSGPATIEIADLLFWLAPRAEI